MSTVAQQFTAEWRPILDPVAKKYGINTDFLLTQIAQESLWGQKTPTGSNNYAGITDFRRKSNVVKAKDAGNIRLFRTFDSKEAFAEHYVNMLSRLYPGTKSAKTIQEFASALQDGKRKYAEAGHYKDALATVYNDHYANGSADAPVQRDPSILSSNGVQLPVYNAGTGLADYAQAIAATGMPVMAPKADGQSDKDPFADMWNIKVPAQQSRSPGVKIESSKPTMSNSYKYKWG